MNRSIAIFRDVVCGMDVNSDDICLDYQGIQYVFCSNQCLERFQSIPHLYIGYPGSEAPKHAGIEVMKTRTLKLAEPLPQEMTDKVIDYIESMMGIQCVAVDGDRIEITYDLLQATESQIETTIADAGAVLGDDWSERLRRAFVHFMEETQVESLKARPVSRGGHRH